MRWIRRRRCVSGSQLSPRLRLVQLCVLSGIRRSTALKSSLCCPSCRPSLQTSRCGDCLFFVQKGLFGTSPNRRNLFTRLASLVIFLEQAILSHFIIQQAQSPASAGCVNDVDAGEHGAADGSRGAGPLWSTVPKISISNDACNVAFVFVSPVQSSAIVAALQTVAVGASSAQLPRFVFVSSPKEGTHTVNEFISSMTKHRPGLLCTTVWCFEVCVDSYPCVCRLCCNQRPPRAG
jgi:hypothetical protein